MTLPVEAGRSGETALTFADDSDATVQIVSRTADRLPAESATPATFSEHNVVVAAKVAPAFNFDWYSVNGGGATGVSSTSYQIGVSAGQTAAGFVSGTAYQLGIGFWYGVAGGGECPIALTGDVNLSTTLTSADIIYLVNFVFKGQAEPLPCAASGDANCSGSVTSADIIFMVNHVFKGQAAPCDVCTLIPGMWSCP